MKPLAVAHRWDLTPKEAVALQRELAPKVVTEDALSPPKTVAGVDVGIEAKGKRARAAVVVLDHQTLAALDRAVASREVEFPYVPGLLSFRELPVVLDAAEKLTVWPDLILCDGQGLAHPRRFGLACHLGVVTNTATIGVGKTRLLGDHEPVPEERGAWVPLRDRDEVIGAVLRSRSRVKPIYVSIGHRVSLESAVRFVMACTRKFRLPETTRQAHHYASVIGPGD